jgi:spore germination cell wall hydrolase CwlJ-like protein
MKSFCTWTIALVCMLLTACAAGPEVNNNISHRYSAISEAVTFNNTASTVSVQKENHFPASLKQNEIEAILALFRHIPISKSPPLSTETPHVNAKDLQCLSKVMYYEARGEGERGMVAVGHVVMNRVADKRFPNTVCNVVKQGKYANRKPVKNKCQFSYVCDGIPDVVKDKETFEKATQLAHTVLTGVSTNPVGKSLYFHTTAVKPKWCHTFAKIKKIGRHIFYA